MDPFFDWDLRGTSLDLPYASNQAGESMFPFADRKTLMQNSRAFGDS
jgi:hypothetical protein